MSPTQTEKPTKKMEVSVTLRTITWNKENIIEIYIWIWKTTANTTVDKATHDKDSYENTKTQNIDTSLRRRENMNKILNNIGTLIEERISKC